MAEIKQNENTVHELYLHDRKRMTVSGVTDVISFDDQLIALKTLCGNMEIEGSSLQVQVLNVEEGIVTMNGRVDLIRYLESDGDENNGKNGFFNRLFR